MSQVTGTLGSDILFGTEDADTLFGGTQANDPTDAADTLSGDAGNDTIYGGVGTNTLEGGAGADTLIAASDADVLTGGDGIDTFIINGQSVTETAELSSLSATGSQDAALLEEPSSALKITDLEAGESFKVTGLSGDSTVQIETINGEAVITDGNGKIIATLTGVDASKLTLTTSGTGDSTATVDVDVVLEGGTASSGGGTPAPNVAPVLADLSTPVAFAENTVNAAAQVIDADVTVTDTTSANFDGGTLNVTYSVGGSSFDSLSIANVGGGAGQIAFDGTTASYEGTAIGTINGANNGTSGSDLVLDFNTDATPTAVEALIENLTFANSSSAPLASRTISITVNDGDGGTSAAVTSEITVTAEADAAVASFAFSALDGSNGFELDGIGASDDTGESVSSAGDINGDGFDDVIVGAPDGDISIANVGNSYVVFGKAASFTATTDLSTLDGSNGFRLDGIAAADNSGASVSSAGDINGDGFDDVIIGAEKADPGGQSNAGESYVIFGKADWTGVSNFALSTLDGSNGFQLDGIDASDGSGVSVSSSGDVNGDGYDDMLIGAWSADPGGQSGAGESYVVFGKASWVGVSNFDLSTLDGSNGFQLNGITAADNSGVAVSAAGDVNGDGLGDVIIGAPSGDANATNAGESYVVFGKADWTGISSFNLSALDGTTGFRLDGDGATTFDSSGTSVSSAGDVNGDGFDDVIVGATGGDAGASGAGESYVVFGKADWTGIGNFNLSALNGTTGFRLDGIDSNDNSGTSVSSAGDVNGDGYNDVIVGAHRANAGINSDSGESYIVFGKADWTGTSTLDLSTLDGTNGFRLDGIDTNDNSGESVSSAGDVNGDGFDDVIVGAPNGNATTGQSHVFFGNNDSSSVDQIGGSGDDTITAAAGGEVIVAGRGNDNVMGGAGVDVLKGANGNDTLSGGGDADRLFGGNGTDNLDGGAGNDFIFAGDGNDTVTGSAGDDSMEGGNGDDTLTGGAGADTMVGGLGDDVFTFTAAGESDSAELDVISLNWDQDKIDISGIGTAAADTITTLAAQTASSLADVVTLYDNTGIDQIGDSSLIEVTVGTLAGNSYVILSTDGNATYDEGTDLFFQVVGGGTFDVGDII